ncbi:hypothetical protein [Aeromonas allosaccharophila]|uniref:hypothetical protein n=1 Tax=Aeromonas allosaccharophila TaxID=656 RepID=UPI002B4768CB|nr:hypothetical protein [Aeromonas allosaccharophila]
MSIQYLIELTSAIRDALVRDDFFEADALMDVRLNFLMDSDLNLMKLQSSSTDMALLYEEESRLRTTLNTYHQETKAELLSLMTVSKVRMTYDSRKQSDE